MNAIHILLVEDNEGDILLTTEALAEAKIFNYVSVVKDGHEAMLFLSKQAPYENIALPDLVLLDVNLPKRNGHEVLEFIKTQEATKHIPVIMFTTSSSEEDINRSYKNYVNCYITKPLDVNDFLQVVMNIDKFWVSIVQLPLKN